MWGADEVRRQAGVVAGIAEDVSRVAVEVAQVGTVDYRSRAAEQLRQRLNDLVIDLAAGRRTCDDAAEALLDHAAALGAVADGAAGAGQR